MYTNKQLLGTLNWEGTSLEDVVYKVDPSDIEDDHVRRLWVIMQMHFENADAALGEIVEILEEEDDEECPRLF